MMITYKENTTQEKKASPPPPFIQYLPIIIGLFLAVFLAYNWRDYVVQRQDGSYVVHPKRKDEAEREKEKTENCDNMQTQVTTIATEYYSSAIDVFDVEKLLAITALTVEYDKVYVTLVVRHEGEWAQRAYEINGDLYVRLVIHPVELFSQDVAVIAKDKLRAFLQTADIEKREPAPLA